MNTKTREVMHSSKKSDWGTPQWFFDVVDKEFHFDIDIAASEQNHKCIHYFTKENDSLNKSWNLFFGNNKQTTVWMNPPFSREEKISIDPWLKKAHDEAMNNGVTVVALVPARPGTKWWRDYCLKAKEIRFIQGRLKFEGAKDVAPFESALVIFEPFETIGPPGLTYSGLIMDDRIVRTRYWDPKTNTYYGENLNDNSL